MHHLVRAWWACGVQEAGAQSSCSRQLASARLLPLPASAATRPLTSPTWPFLTPPPPFQRRAVARQDRRVPRVGGHHCTHLRARRQRGAHAGADGRRTAGAQRAQHAVPGVSRAAPPCSRPAAAPESRHRRACQPAVPALRLPAVALPRQHPTHPRARAGAAARLPACCTRAAAATRSSCTCARRRPWTSPRSRWSTCRRGGQCSGPRLRPAVGAGTGRQAAGRLRMLRRWAGLGASRPHRSRCLSTPPRPLQGSNHLLALACGLQDPALLACT